MSKVPGMKSSSRQIEEFFENEQISNVEEQSLKIREIFYSLQGEGGRAGEPSIFIRLAYCNKNNNVK